MAQETFTADQFNAELDDLGEKKVRERLIAKQWGDVGPKHDLVLDWLRRKELSKQNRLAWIGIVVTAIAAVAAIVAAVPVIGSWFSP